MWYFKFSERVVAKKEFVLVVPDGDGQPLLFLGPDNVPHVARQGVVAPLHRRSANVQPFDRHRTIRLDLESDE